MADAPYLASRLQGFGTTIFAEMSALAVRDRRRSTSARASPTPTGPPRCTRPPIAAIRAGHNQYPPGPGIPELRARHRRAPAALLRPRRSTPTPRCSSPPAPPRRSPPRCSRCASRATRSSRSSRTTTRTRRASRWRAPTRRVVHARARPTTPFDADELRGRDHAAHAADPAQLAAQPDRQGVHARPSSTSIAELCVEHDLLAVTDEVYEHLVFDGEHIPLATLPGHARAHGHDLVGRQDVLVHRLEGRLGRARRPSSSTRCARPSSSSPT